MLLEEIINVDEFETDVIECKRNLNKDDIVGWLKTIAGFANAKGGDLFIGVEDKTNKLIGFAKDEVDSQRNYFNNQVNEHLTPRPKLKISFLKYDVNQSERYIIQVHVYESFVKPVILKYKGIPSIFMRREGFTNGATYEEIIEMSLSNKKQQYDTMVSDEKYNFGDFKILKNYYSDHNDGKELKEKALRSIGFFDEDNLLANGAVFFKDDYDGLKTEVQCSLFSGFNKGSERIVTINKFHGNIIRVIEYMVEFVNQRMNHSIIKKDDMRVNIDAYPSRAVFEGIINAVAHRDYFIDGTQIQIDMFKDRLEISSPGSFYKGNQIEKTYELSNIISKRRNELISSVLVMCNVMEAAGTGFDKIVEEYNGVDDMHRPYIYSTSDHFTLVLPDFTYLEGVEENGIPKLSFIPVDHGTEHDKKVLEYCYTIAHKSSDIAAYLGITDSSYFRKKVLDNLVDNHYLEKSKNSRATFYKTNRDYVRLE